MGFFPNHHMMIEKEKDYKLTVVDPLKLNVHNFQHFCIILKLTPSSDSHRLVKSV